MDLALEISCRNDATVRNKREHGSRAGITYIDGMILNSGLRAARVGGRNPITLRTPRMAKTAAAPEESVLSLVRTESVAEQEMNHQQEYSQCRDGEDEQPGPTHYVCAGSKEELGSEGH